MTKTTATPAMTLKAAALLPLLALTACASSQRFTGPVAGGPSYGQGQPTLQPAPPISSAPVTSQPLPPPGGYPATGGYPAAGGYPAPGAPDGGLPPPEDPFFDPNAGAPPGQGQPLPPAQGETPQLRGGGGQVATLGQGSGSSRPTPSRDNIVGNWTAREATGSSCRVQLSSSPALDLYRANASGCSNRDLQRVTAWDYRDGEVYLYQQGGSVVARLRTSGGGAMNGAVTKSGAALSLNR